MAAAVRARLAQEVAALTTLELGWRELPSATLGGVNPLPPLSTLAQPVLDAAGIDIDDEMRAGLTYGRVRSTLPYLAQDRYDRALAPRRHRVAVLENGLLRAEVLLDLGGRLRSLVDLGSGRELLYANAAFQPGNLALRDAWFAGGVEWNLGLRGHTPLTCSPLHAGLVDGPGGVPVLRLWEYERLREVVYSLDLWLPAGSPVLLVATRVVNPNDHAVPMYWWSNIAVAQGEDTRVLAPADSAYHVDEGRHQVEVVAMQDGDVDHTHPARAERADDFFFRLDRGERPWIAAVDGTGTGVFEMSTPELRGRKLFVWGGTPGGRHWQEWLSPEGGEYFEVQAGLLRTQHEHVAMPAQAEWSWLEAYGPVTIDPNGDAAAARAAVAEAIRALVPDEWLLERRTEADLFASASPVQILHRGSGWGALERRRRAGSGADEGLDRPGTPFPEDTLGPEQEPWLSLLADGRLPTGTDPGTPPPSYLVAPGWADLLERTTDSGDWLTWLHVGVARHHAGDVDGALDAWQRSTGATPNAWALRNRAVALRDRGDLDGAVAALREAHEIVPEEVALVVELLEALVESSRDGEALTVVDRLPAELAGEPKVRYLEARAAVGTGDLGRAGPVLRGEVPMPWIREGGRLLDELWAAYQARLPEDERSAQVPYALDFRTMP